MQTDADRYHPRAAYGLAKVPGIIDKEARCRSVGRWQSRRLAAERSSGERAVQRSADRDVCRDCGALPVASPDSATEADDLVQAACERALARAHQFQEGTRFDSWMFRIVQTIWIDQMRAREVRKEDGDVAEERLGTDEPVRRIEARLALAEVRGRLIDCRRTSGRR